jgi:hypothetical protein
VVFSARSHRFKVTLCMTCCGWVLRGIGLCRRLPLLRRLTRFAGSGSQALCGLQLEYGRVPSCHSGSSNDWTSCPHQRILTATHKAL